MKLNFTFLTLLIVLNINTIKAQIIPTNTNPVSLENNLLLNAQNRYKVTQTGSASFSNNYLFDGKFSPYYCGAIDENNPVVILIEGLPASHTQTGAWIGWSTRYWPAKKFKIEAYDVYYGHGWMPVADITDNTARSYLRKMPAGAFTKLRITIYESTQPSGRVGLSEIYFIHPEAASLYVGKMPSDMWSAKGNLGLGTTKPGAKLDVNGKIRAEEIEIISDVPASDYVFEKEYDLLSIDSLNNFVQHKKHLPGVPSAEAYKQNGYKVGQMDDLLLRKIEELTLYIIKQEKNALVMRQEIIELQKENIILKNKINAK